VGESRVSSYIYFHFLAVANDFLQSTSQSVNQSRASTPHFIYSKRILGLYHILAICATLYHQRRAPHIFLSCFLCILHLRSLSHG
jgi:hypothetical protein